MLDEMIKDYLELKEKEEKIKSQKTELGNKIKEELKKLPENKFEGFGVKASITNKTTFNYSDETAIINYLTMKGLGDVYLTKSIDTKKLNAELKKEGILFENVKPYVTKTITEALNASKD